jgi:nucleoid-associated protein YgaU
VTSLFGREILEEFDLFLDEYQAEVSKELEGQERTYLVFRALNEKQAFKVEPLEWQWSEDAENTRHTYAWSLKLEAYEHAPPTPRIDLFSPVTSLLKTAQEYVDVASGSVLLVSSALDNAGSELNEVKRTFATVGRLLDAFGTLARSADGVVSFFTKGLPLELNSVVQQFKNAVDEYQEISNSLESTEWTRLAESLGMNALTIAGYSGATKRDLDKTKEESVETTVREGESEPLPPVSLDYTVRQGDTLKKIAVANFGDVEQWKSIASLNGMRNAETWRNGRPLLAGDVLKIPLNIARELRTVSRFSFGKDLELDASGDLVLEGDDLSTIENKRNLEQALRLRLLCEQGSSFLMPSYGLPVSIGEANTAKKTAFVSSHIRDQLEQDPRIRDLEEIKVESNGDSLDVYVKVLPIAGDVLDVVLPYPTN